jgi:hypothetical protein
MPPKTPKPKGKDIQSDSLSKKEILVMPTHIRRNLRTRTYSGANLSKIDKMTDIQKKLTKSVHTLMWDNKKSVSSLPPLACLDFDVEMKLMDIIMGEDPLNEGTTTQEHNSKRAKLAQKNLEEALSLAGKKRLLLQERYRYLILIIDIIQFLVN